MEYKQNIVGVIAEIQSDKGNDFLDRQKINRDIRNKQAFISEIRNSLPIGYKVEDWEDKSTGAIYQQIERIQYDNNQILQAKSVIDNSDNKRRAIDADRDIKLAALDKQCVADKSRISNQIRDLHEHIKQCETEQSTHDATKLDQKETITSKQYPNISYLCKELA